LKKKWIYNEFSKKIKEITKKINYFVNVCYDFIDGSVLLNKKKTDIYKQNQKDRK
jgi:hypothetical protein